MDKVRNLLATVRCNRHCWKNLQHITVSGPTKTPIKCVSCCKRLFRNFFRASLELTLNYNKANNSCILDSSGRYLRTLTTHNTICIVLHLLFPRSLGASFGSVMHLWRVCSLRNFWFECILITCMTNQSQMPHTCLNTSAAPVYLARLYAAYIRLSSARWMVEIAEQHMVTVPFKYILCSLPTGVSLYYLHGSVQSLRSHHDGPGVEIHLVFHFVHSNSIH